MTALYYAKWGGSTKCIKLLNAIFFSNNTKDVETVNDKTNRINKNTELVKPQGTLDGKTHIKSQHSEQTQLEKRVSDSTQTLHKNSTKSVVSQQDNATLETFQLHKEQSISRKQKENKESNNLPTNVTTIEMHNQTIDGRMTTRKAQQNQCTECKCKMCVSKGKAFNSLQQDTSILNEKVAEMEDRDIWFDANDSTLIERILGLESRIK